MRRSSFGTGKVDHILEEENFSLLERDVRSPLYHPFTLLMFISKPPFLCADRMDYGLRDSLALGQLSSSQVKTIREDFCVVNGRFAHKSKDIARMFCEAYMVSLRFARSSS
jgi:HD superfamily phosphohydrolase